jgi:hypothetical protein
MDKEIIFLYLGNGHRRQLGGVEQSLTSVLKVVFAILNI